MAATPKRKHSTQRQGKRRSQISQTSKQFEICKHCGKKKLAHFTCSSCGY